MFDLGLKDSRLRHDADGIRLARDLGVEAMLAVLVRVRGDTAEVEATLFDAQ
jgi:hypothetical protein